MEEIREEQANEALVAKLKSLNDYIDSDLPEWKKLIAIGGFVADVIKTLKWSEKPFCQIHSYQKEHVMSCEQITEDIAVAIQSHIFQPIKSELDAMLCDWESMKNEKYKDIQTITDMNTLIVARMEEYQPGFVNYYVKHFYPELMPELLKSYDAENPTSSPLGQKLDK